ncbi:MAG: polysaccharide biosynthesis/export family protein [Bacteriovoracaceae bacterium]
MLKNFWVFLLVFQFSFSVHAEENKPEFDLKELALPSEVDNIGKSAGAVYYSPSVKGKVLIPVNIWGEVRNSGLHFIPVDTTLIQGLSLAGGPTNKANLERVKLSRRTKIGGETRKFDLREGGDDEVARLALRPGDTIFVEKSNFLEDRNYYTSLFGVIATVLSSILLYREVKK